MLSNQSLQLNELDLPTLKKLAFETDVFLFKQPQGGEDYTARYRKDPKVFEQLIKQEVTFKNELRELFRGQVDRLPYLVNLFVVKADESIDPETLFVEREWEQQEQEMGSTLFDNLYPLIFLGANAMESEFSYHTKWHTDPTIPTKVSGDYASKLGKNLTTTTKDLILRHVKLSIKLGENRDKLVERLTKYVDSEARATMIAQTESVRMYGKGRLEIAVEIGLKTKEWESGVGACLICAELNSKYGSGKGIPTSDSFVSDMLGASLVGEPAHPHCKCSVHYLK